ncbi:nicotinate phosphoribosyltransferase [Aquisphaera insulae]|uniref:nicotinate phosphoribosyltransferase n=1 Tax=Aquisphaera insulae TaxID=2712864 RepID=UPI00202EE9C3|nr:nicotinate phosphoribosyltransferase [Aquisphaera insulae]
MMEPIPPVSLWPDPHALGPVTDLYQLTMMAGYRALGMADVRASFEVFVRRLPPGRSYLVFAGLEQAVGDLLNLRFSPDQVDGLRAFPAFAGVSPEFFEHLASLRFEGDVWSVREGTVVFPGETLLRVSAPLAQAQWVETFLLASLSYTTLVASKAARIVTAARGRTLLEFGARRGHGPQTGFLAARAAYLAGFHGTSHVEAARRLKIPASGTMAHSWVQSFPTEEAAFEAYARVFPESTTLLIDTYDTLAAARKAALIEPRIRAVRLDSGDLDALSRGVRAILDESGRPDIRIVASGDLDEYQIERLIASGAPIDAFGVGTELITSRDAPALSMVYKLVESDGQGRIKLSAGKKTYPMAKQVFRRRDRDGRFAGDLVARADELQEGERLLSPVVLGGRLVAPLPRMEAIRTHCADQLASLPPGLTQLDGPADYPVTYSDLLEEDARRLMEQGG